MGSMGSNLCPEISRKGQEKTGKENEQKYGISASIATLQIKRYDNEESFEERVE